MEWSDVGKKVLGLGLPILGTALAGPAGTAVGGLVASALGLSDSSPEQVMNSLETDSQKSTTALAALQNNHRFELERLSIQSATQELLAINSTMQAETRSEDPFSRRWRPFWGFCSALSWSLMSAAIAWDIACGKNGEVIGKLSSIPESFWLIPLTILGVASYHRGKKQRIEAGELYSAPQDTGLLGKIRSSLLGQQS
ncbi:holin family protein [Desulfobaculum bizertense]|uniref:3TM-type holin n=1 Tax=Desulfobaculum bizertense TaxID=376490 RepID=UPI001F315FAA|nr:3TM-type holin [Desulfobaculum bizertense]UIJ36888.1 holin family protein [Desulfobaculum bizertense]